MIRALPALALAFVLLSVACDSGEDDPPIISDEPTAVASPTVAASACARAREHTPGDSRETITSGGEERAYILHVPQSYNGNAATPLVLVFHPFNGTAESVAALTEFAQ